MSGAHSRNKGHGFERKIAKDLRESLPHLFSEAKRGYQSRNNIDLAPDVDIPLFFVECKAHQKTNIKQALKQALDTKPKNDTRFPLSICKDDYCQPIVSMYYEDFKKLLELINLNGQSDSDKKNDSSWVFGPG